MGAARSAIGELEVAVTMLRSGHYDYGLQYVGFARKDIRWARWDGFKQHGLDPSCL